MRGRTLGLSVGLALVAMVALSTSAFAFASSGTVTGISINEDGSIWITINNGVSDVKKQVHPAFSATQKNQILAVALTAQAAGTSATIYITAGTIRQITSP